MRHPRLPTHAELSTGAREHRFTGRYLLILRNGALDEATKLLATAGFSVSLVPGTESGTTNDSEVKVFPEIGIALLSGEGDHLQRVSKLVSDNPSGPIIAVTAEKVIAPSAQSSTFPESAPMMKILEGYHHAVAQVINFDATPATFDLMSATTSSDQGSNAAWGLVATRVLSSRFSGRGIRVAIADSGLDGSHPDFKNRIVGAFSAVPNTTPQDHVGHGTQCTGIACGPLAPSSSPRYGVAGDSGIAVVKVVNDGGIGAQEWLINGCNWAIANGCRIICLAMQDAVSPGEPPDPVYEALGNRCLARGTLVVAAAGNDSDRTIGNLRPVSAPANCVSIMGVGAVGVANGQLRVAPFSNAGGNGPGSDIDLIAPGVSILSSCPLPVGYTTGSGTSQAAAFVAGIAALVFEANPNVGPVDVWRLLTQNAQRLPFPPTDVGAGLVQAPQ